VDDHVGTLVEQWRTVRPDLDIDTMATVARLIDVARLINARIEAGAEKAGISIAEGDLLFTLRRGGAPERRMLPSQLSAALLVSSGTMTSRLDRLERLGLIRRVPNPEDRRSVEIELTSDGVRLVDAAVTAHVAAEQEMLEPLSDRERAQLDRLTTKLAAGLRQAAG
jgi:DNA-binding MarR family transcriptional regulator